MAPFVAAESRRVGRHGLHHQRASNACPSPSGLTFHGATPTRAVHSATSTHFLGVAADDGPFEDQAVKLTPLSRRVWFPVQFIIQSGRVRARFPGQEAPDGFKPSPLTLNGYPTAEDGILENHTLQCALVSSEARHPVRFVFLSVAGGTRTHISHYGYRLRRSGRYDDMEPTHRVEL